MSFQVFDDNGDIWPPGFQSVLCDPANPNGMCYDRRISSATASAMALAALEKAKAESRTRWGDMLIGAGAQRARKAAPSRSRES